MAIHPAPYFTRYVSDLLAEAPSFRSAERFGHAVVIPHAVFVSDKELSAILKVWSENDQCRIASGMPDLAVELFMKTEHLGDDRRSVFDEFIQDVRERESEDSPYDYLDLEAAIARHRSA